MGIEGGMVQMVSHGFISGALFLCVGVLYDRVSFRQINDYAAWRTPCRSSPPSWCCCHGNAGCQARGVRW